MSVYSMLPTVLFVGQYLSVFFSSSLCFSKSPTVYIMRPCKRDFLRATPEATRTRQNETNDSGLTSGQSPNHPLPALPFSFPLPSQFSTPQEQTQTPNHNDAMSRRFCVFVDVLNGCLTDAEKVDHSRSIVGG